VPSPRLHLFVFLGIALLLIPQIKADEDTIKDLPPILTSGLTSSVVPADQMRHYLLDEADAAWGRWKTAFEERLTDPQSILVHEKELREKFLASIGGLPERTPLNAHVTGTLQRPGFIVEKVIFESQPRFYVTAALFLPDPEKFPGSRPGVLVSCGHYAPTKSHDEYQSMGALLALNGMVALVFDPIEQDERLQSVDASGHSRFWGTSSHALDDIQAIPLGQSVARYFIWDGMRGIDYLQTRPEVDSSRIGITGNSGGGTQAAYLFALDDRIKVAALSCYIQNLAAQIRSSMGEGEQNIFGELAFGLDHADFILMRAPAPVKLLAATHDFFNINATWETFRYIKRAYTSLGYSERAAILENDAGHNYNRTQREGAARWLARWLLGNDEPISEPPLKLFTEEEMRCTPRGQVMLIPGARSIHDLLRESADQAAVTRKHRWAEMSSTERHAAVRHIAGFPALGALPPDNWTKVWERLGPNQSHLTAWRVRTADGALAIPALWIEPAQFSNQPAILFLSSQGIQAEMTPGGHLDGLARTGRRILAIDVRGTGETRQNNQAGLTAAVGRDYWDLYSAYMLGRTYTGMQAGDILTAVLELQRRNDNDPIDLMTFGDVGVPALHVAFAEPDCFHQVILEGMIKSWDGVVRADRTYGQFMQVVHGALRTYDLPDLATALGSKLTQPSPVSELGLDGDHNAPIVPGDLAPTQPGLIGLLYNSPRFQNPQTVDKLPGSDVNWNTKRDGRGGDWAAQWSGFLVPDVTGEINLALETSEEATLMLNDREAARADAKNPRATTVIYLQAGHAVPCAIRFVQPRRETNPDDYTSTLRLLWRKGQGEWQPVPANWLWHTRQQQRDNARALR